ncbi:hypothetical protein VTH82DRAFT_4397 [Thermothelomyces myriococcoides]
MSSPPRQGACPDCERLVRQPRSAVWNREETAVTPIVAPKPAPSPSHDMPPSQTTQE